MQIGAVMSDELRGCTLRHNSAPIVRPHYAMKSRQEVEIGYCNTTVNALEIPLLVGLTYPAQQLGNSDVK